MRSKEEQIKFILSYKAFGDWPRVVKDREYLADKTYFDFINVTYAEVCDFAIKNGLGPNGAKELTGVKYDLEELDFATCIEGTPNGFEVFYVERGQKEILGLFRTREEAVCDQVKRMIEASWVQLTFNYCEKHYPGKTPAEVMEMMSPFDDANLKR